AALFGMIQRSPQQFPSQTTALQARRYKELRQKPQFAAHPTEGRADNLSVLFRDPKAPGIVVKRKKLETRGTNRGHRAKAVTLRQIVDACDDKRLRRLQILEASWSHRD